MSEASYIIFSVIRGVFMAIQKKAAAKINLLLDLTGVFENGYHGIYTIMQSVGIFDEITVEKNRDIVLQCNRENIPVDKRNTAFKAAEYFFAYTGIKGGAYINIEKNIPSGAGMAGGSADAAAVIKALDELYGTSLSEKEMCVIGKKIGADVPFCIVGGTALCLNIGEVIAPLPDFNGYRIVCVKPKTAVNTASAYAEYDNLCNVRHPAKEEAVNAYMNGDMKKFFSLCANVFEQAVDVPGRAEIKSVMRAFKCDFTLMTGSGSVVYGIFADCGSAEKCAQSLRISGREVFVTEPVAKGVF